jgi:hypothetical protein
MEGISIIICSRYRDVKNELKNNINKTIGTDYELIVIDNFEGEYSIFSAYNEGAKRAEYPFLCFMHDDIMFHTSGWGLKVLQHLKDPKVGIIGIAGSHYAPRMPGSHWSCSGITSCNVIHNIKGEISNELWTYFDSNKISKQAVILDGLWLCISRETMNKIKFDNITFSGYHYYDSDICLQSKKMNYENIIVLDIKIEHFSLGNRDKSWLSNSIIFFKKWGKDLPISSIELTKSEKVLANYSNARDFLEQIFRNDSQLQYFIRIWFYYLQCNPPFNKKNLVLAVKLLKVSFIDKQQRYKKQV